MSRDTYLREKRLLERVVPDIERVLNVKEESSDDQFDADMALPGGLWDPDDGVVAGGVNYADNDTGTEEEDDDGDPA